MKTKKAPQKKVIKQTKFDAHIKQKQNTKTYKLKNSELVKKTIQKQYRGEMKEGKFQDDRLIKSQMINEGSKRQKKNIFDIDREENDQGINTFTHMGKQLDYKDDFLPDQSDLEDNDSYDKVVQREHFGGFEENNKNDQNQKKSKEDIYKEIIKKSKSYRMERQKLKEQNEEEKDRVDDEYMNIASLLKFRKKGEKTLPQPGDDYNQMHISLQDERRTKANEKKNNPNKKKRVKKGQFDTENCFSSEESYANDDQLDEKINNKSKTNLNKIEMAQRKQVKLNDFISKVKEQNQNNSNENSDDFDDIYDSEEDDDDEDEDEDMEDDDENEDMEEDNKSNEEEDSIEDGSSQENESQEN